MLTRPAKPVPLETKPPEVIAQGLDLLFQDHPLGYWRVDASGQLLAVNESYCRMAGLARTDVLGRTVVDLVPGVSPEEVAARNHQVKLTGMAQLTVEQKGSDGSTFQIEVQIIWIPLLHQTYALLRPLAAAEESRAMEAQGNRFQRLVEHQGDGFTIVDEQERITYANPASEIIFGVPQGTLVGRSLHEFLEPSQLALVMAKTNDRKSGKEGSYELWIRRPDATARLLYVTVTRELSAQGHYLGSVGVFRDITDQRSGEDRLRASEARFRRLLQEAPMAIAMIRGGRILGVNLRFLELTGFEREEELVGQPDHALIHPEDQHVIQDLEEGSRQGSRAFRKLSFRGLRRDGSLVMVQAWSRALSLDDGPAYLVFLEDITVQRQAERDRERLIQELSGALAEVRQLSGLLPICATCKKIRDEKGEWSPLETYISSRSGADFTHGICPECAKVFRKEFLGT